MTDTPTAAMKNMTLREQDAPPTSTKAMAKPPRSPRYKFPPMPADAGTCGRYYFFGFPATFSALSKLAVDYCGPIQNPNNPDYSAFDGVRRLRALTGYRYLHLFSGVAQEGEEPQEEGPDTAVIPGEKATPVVGVFVNIREYAHRRPTQKQMDALIKILGQPRWCMDAWPMKDFQYYGVM